MAPDEAAVEVGPQQEAPLHEVEVDRVARVLVVAHRVAAALVRRLAEPPRAVDVRRAELAAVEERAAGRGVEGAADVQPPPVAGAALRRILAVRRDAAAALGVVARGPAVHDVVVGRLVAPGAPRAVRVRRAARLAHLVAALADRAARRLRAGHVVRDGARVAVVLRGPPADAAPADLGAVGVAGLVPGAGLGHEHLAVAAPAGHVGPRRLVTLIRPRDRRRRRRRRRPALVAGLEAAGPAVVLEALALVPPPVGRVRLRDEAARAEGRSLERVRAVLARLAAEEVRADARRRQPVAHAVAVAGPGDRRLLGVVAVELLPLDDVHLARALVFAGRQDGVVAGLLVQELRAALAEHAAVRALVAAGVRKVRRRLRLPVRRPAAVPRAQRRVDVLAGDLVLDVAEVGVPVPLAVGVVRMTSEEALAEGLDLLERRILVRARRAVAVVVHRAVRADAVVPEHVVRAADREPVEDPAPQARALVRERDARVVGAVRLVVRDAIGEVDLAALAGGHVQVAHGPPAIPVRVLLHLEAVALAELRLRGLDVDVGLLVGAAARRRVHVRDVPDVVVAHPREARAPVAAALAPLAVARVGHLAGRLVAVRAEALVDLVSFEVPAGVLAVLRGRRADPGVRLVLRVVAALGSVPARLLADLEGRPEVAVVAAGAVVAVLAVAVGARALPGPAVPELAEVARVRDDHVAVARGLLAREAHLEGHGAVGADALVVRPDGHAVHVEHEGLAGQERRPELLGFGEGLARRDVGVDEPVVAAHEEAAVPVEDRRVH